MSDTIDLYAELGVTTRAEPEVIRAAYRALALRYHPDRQGVGNALAAARMARINQAYEVLSHPERRRAYDLQRCAQPARPRPPLLHAISARTSRPNTQPFLTTYDARGRLHSFV